MALASMGQAATLSLQLVSEIDGAGTVSGSYDFDTDSGLFSNINLVSTGGLNIAATTFEFARSTASDTRIDFISSDAADLTGAIRLVLGLSDSLNSLAVSGNQIVAVPSGFSEICEEATCPELPAFGPTSRGIFSGTTSKTVTAVPTVPLPAGALSLAFGSGGLALLRKRRKV